MIDFKDKKDSALVTIQKGNNEQKLLYNTKHLIISDGSQSNVYATFAQDKKIYTQYYQRNATIPLQDIQHIENQESESENKPSRLPVCVNHSFDEGHMNVCSNNNTLFSMLPLNNQLYIQVLTHKNYGNTSLEKQANQYLHDLLPKFERTYSSDKPIKGTYATISHHHSAKIQQNNIYLLGSLAHQYPTNYHTINQSCADADNIARKIIHAYQIDEDIIVSSYQPERTFSHTIDHMITKKVTRGLLRAGISGFASGLINTRALLSKRFQHHLYIRYSGTKDEYPESTRCIEEYPSLTQMAPRNHSIDVTRKDGVSFFL